MDKASSNGSRSFAKVADQHALGNRRSKDDWELYRGHRERFTAALLDLAPGVAPAAGGLPTLCLLGAGNCNDVDLTRLAERFGVIHLVDIDAGALARARERQPANVRAQLVLHGGVDLTGMLAPLDRWKGKTPDGATLVQAVSEGVAELGRVLPAGEVDLAVSCCLMSQLGWSLVTALGTSRPGADPEEGISLELRLATITVHLQTLATLARKGGQALLASDIVSSDLYPLDELPPDTDLRALADRLVAEQQVVYAGANPLLVSRLLRKDPALKVAFTGPTILPPWLWTGQFDRTYLVYPQLLQRL